MANLFKVTAKGKWIASVHAVKPTGFVTAQFSDGANLAPDRDAIRDALPHYWRKAFDRAQLSRYSHRDGGPFDNEVFYTLYSANNRHLITVYC